MPECSQTQVGWGPPSSGWMYSACGSVSSQAWHSGQRPISSRSASWTSWATSPATYCLPSSHCEAHHRRVVTAASSAETVVGLAAAVTSRSCNTRARAFMRASSDVTMSIVSTDQGRSHEVGPLLEVVALHPRDAAAADEGGADRVLVVADVESGGLSAEPALVSSVCKETDLPVRAMLRLNDSYTTTGGELTRLVGLGEEYLAVGAEGLSFGFLDVDLLVDVEVCAHLADALDGVPWTFHRAIDASLEADLAWRQVHGLPGVDAVLSAGSPQGLGTGHEELTDRAVSDPDVARLLMAGGGLRGEHVPWLVRAGVRQFHVGSSARPGGSWKAHVEAGHVRAWRMLLDDAADLAAGRPAG